MKFYISFCLINFIIDFSIILMVNYFGRLYNSKKELASAIILSLFPSVILVMFKIEYYQFVLVKLLDYFVLSLLITNDFKASKIIFLYTMLIVSMFSIYGFIEFFIEFINAIFNSVFGKKIDIFYNFLIVFALFAYIFALILLFGIMFKKQNIQGFLYKVSFLLFGNHIEIIGLLDSGNSLYDTKTGKAVMIATLSSIRKFIDETLFDKLMNDDYNDLEFLSRLDCVMVGGNRITIPIIDIGEVKIKQSENGKQKICKCVLGLTKENFAESNDYECLLHREFL